MYTSTKSFENIPNGHLNGGSVMINGDGNINGSTQCNGKLAVYANGDHPVVVPSASAPLNHRPVSPSTSVIILPSSANRNHHNWKNASLRNTSTAVLDGNTNGNFVTCSSPAFRQQTTVDDTHSNTTRSYSLKLEVPTGEVNGGVWSGANSPSYNSSTNCLFSTSVESTGVSILRLDGLI
jgi:hypothetical protein